MLEELYAKPDLSQKVAAQPQEMGRETGTDTGTKTRPAGDRNAPIYDNMTYRSTEAMIEEPQTGTVLSICLTQTHTPTRMPSQPT